MPASVDIFPLSAAFERVQERLHRAAQRAGRRPEDIDLLAVTKSQDVRRVEEAFRLGIRQVGESRVQEAAAKRAACGARNPAGGPRWHLVGHLQSNKVRRAVEIFDCLQSLDSLKLAELINQEGERRGRPVSCLVEVKISGESAKQGLDPDALQRFLEQAGRLPGLRIEGLMGIAPLLEDPAGARPSFARLKKTFDRCASFFPVPRPILSMGMSHDFESAVEEGSTMVRIGSALFGSRPA